MQKNENPIKVQIPHGADSAYLVNFMTVVGLLPHWMRNMAENMENILSGKHLRDIKPLEGPAIVIGAGPSIWNKKHLDTLAQSRYKGSVITTDRMLIPCLKKGIIPKFVCSLDADSKVIPGFFDHDLVRKHSKDMYGIFSTFVHKDIFKHFKGERYFFQNIMDDPNNPMSLTRALGLMTRCSLVAGSGDVGGFSWHMGFHILRCNPIALLGIDYSEKKVEDIKDYKQYLSMTPKKDQNLNKYFQRHYQPFFKTFGWSGPLFETYLNAFIDRLKMVGPLGVKTINCTEGGVLHGKYMDSMMFKDFLKKEEEGFYDGWSKRIKVKKKIYSRGSGNRTQRKHGSGKKDDRKV